MRLFIRTWGVQRSVSESSGTRRPIRGKGSESSD